MRTTALLALVAMATASLPARADLLDGSELYRRAQGFVQSLMGRRAADWEVIKPPGDMDAAMILPPRQSQDTMQIIRPRDFGR